MNKKTIIKGLFLGLGVICLQSCDKDFNAIGDGVIGEPNFEIETYKVSDIKAYSQAMGSGNVPGGVETGNLSEMYLGSYEDPIFGNTTASFVTAVDFPKEFPSTFEANNKVDYVYVYIPYFGELDKASTGSYKLNNIYGSGDFNLEIYENGYYLYESNIGGINDLKKFYSNDIDIIAKQEKHTKLNDSSDPKQNTKFVFDQGEIVVYKRDKNGDIIKKNGEDVVKERLAAGLWVELNTDYFQNLIFENREHFKDAETFNDYFRGLFFKVSANSTSKGAIGKLNFANARLVVNYSEENGDNADKGEEEKEGETITFSINGEVPNISFFDNTFSGDYLQALQGADKTNGDEKLYLKGGNGSLAIIDIFNGEDQEELKRLKSEKFLINEAILTIYVDKETMNSGQYEPERLYLYDIDKNKRLIDYISDPSKENTVNFKSSFGGFLEKGTSEEDKKGLRYRFKITDHIRAILKKEGTFSPKLGLISVDRYVNSKDIVLDRALKQEIENTPSPIKSIPSIGVSQPLGTVLYGSKNRGENQAIKLDILYTKIKK